MGWGRFRSVKAGLPLLLGEWDGGGGIKCIAGFMVLQKKKKGGGCDMTWKGGGYGMRVLTLVPHAVSSIELFLSKTPCFRIGFREYIHCIYCFALYQLLLLTSSELVGTKGWAPFKKFYSCLTTGLAPSPTLVPMPPYTVTSPTLIRVIQKHHCPFPRCLPKMQVGKIQLSSSHGWCFILSLPKIRSPHKE